MRSLPLWLESEDFRAVHACWSEPIIEKLRSRFNGNTLPEELLEESANVQYDLFESVEIILMGKELPLPSGITFPDKDGPLAGNTVF